MTHHDTLALLVLSALFLVGGLALHRNWRPIGDWAAMYANPRLLFGPRGELELVRISYLAIGAGALGVVYSAFQILR